MRLRPAFILPLLTLAACGGGDEEQAAEGPGVTAGDEILEGTIDDSMIDLTGGETMIVTEKPAEAAE